MIHYCLAHLAYHFSRWLPKHHRFRLQLVILVLGISALLLQLCVLLRPRSSRYCGQPLLYNLVASIVFTFFTTGLAVLLVMMDPVPGELKIILSVFGIGSLAEGICTAVLTASAPECAVTTPELYCLSVTLSVCSILSAAWSTRPCDEISWERVAMGTGMELETEGTESCKSSSFKDGAVSSCGVNCSFLPPRGLS
ncbi:uncharacterized protein LOC128338442 isoform X3 [Hemicordylus capensis]|nr:uncharacterized protein LOC128338442 isoform X3 [Hemicordylus capensis]